MIRDPHIAIIGAGIGGLTAALCFRHFGYRVDVFEQSPELNEVGAGIQISPNALRVFEQLGLEQTLKASGLQAQAIQLMNHAPARAVARLDLSQSRALGGYFLFHRADLVQVLVDACRDADVTIHLGQTIDGPTALQQDKYDLIVAADGLHSQFRKRLNPQTRAFFTGQVAWRSVVENVISQPPEARVHMGPHRHVVTYPIRDGRALNMVCIKEQADWCEEGWNHPDDPSILKQEFGDFIDLLPVFDQVHTLQKWGLFRHPVASHWAEDNVVIMGDAAHPTLPFLAQGAVMAIEDAWVLAACFHRHGTKGLGMYQSIRMPRVTRVLAAANANAWKYHLANPIVRCVAHTVLGAGSRIAPTRLVRQFDWIYAHDVTQDVT